MIKVLQVIGSLNRGGAETMLMNLYNHINKNNIKFDFLVFGEEIGEYEKEILIKQNRVIHIDYPKNDYMKFIKNVKKVIDKYGPYKIIHCHTLFNSGLVAYAAHNRVKKIIIHAHSTQYGKDKNIFNSLYIRLMRKLIKTYGTHFWACGKEAGFYLFGDGNFECNGKIINNGIDVEKFKFNYTKRVELRKKNNIEDQFVVGHVGNFYKVKNQSFILNVFLEILKKKENSFLILIGDGPLKANVEKQALKLGIKKKVLFTGNIPNVNEYMQIFDAFVFPSLFEGLPVSVIEAQTSGLRCCISDSITNEIEITDLVRMISLNEDAYSWANEVLVPQNIKKRIDYAEIIKRKEYDIKSVCQKVLEYYEE